MEGAFFSMQQEKDEKLEKICDSIIDKIIGNMINKKITKQPTRIDIDVFIFINGIVKRYV